MNEQHFDIVIIGSGMVGSALACALGESDLKICIVDAGEPQLSWPIDGYEMRVSAITKASQNFFKNIGAWQGMQERRVFPYQKMHVWDATGSGEISFDCADVGEANLGHIIENRVIQGALVDQVTKLSNIVLLSQTKPVSLNVTDSCVEIKLSNGQSLTSGLLVGADGARSWVRNEMGIDTIGWAYQQNGVVTTVELEKAHQQTAWQRFLPTGPLAFLPLDEKHCSIVWSTTEQESARLMALDDEHFVQELNEAVGESELGKVLSCAKRGAFPLRLQHTKDYIRPRIALIGDAAHTIHPLAGQGVNLGLLDAAMLAETLFEASRLHKDIGRYSVLRRYERARKGDNIMMMTAMDGFKRLFSNDNKSLSLFRNMGLNAANSIRPLKTLFVRQAIGSSRDLPRLSRGLPLI